jgi:hypothetical protein
MQSVRFAAIGVPVALVVCVCAAGVGAQGGAAETAARMTGTWKINRELSTGIGDSGPGDGRRGRRGGGPAFQIAAQRGGGRGGGGSADSGERPSLTSTEASAQAALMTIQQLPAELTITATPAEITILEPRGSSQFRIDNKSADIEVPGGATIKVKSRWDRTTLRQEFSSVQRVLKRSWAVDGNGRLIVKQRVESIDFVSKEAEAVFDRQ